MINAQMSLPEILHVLILLKRKWRTQIRKADAWTRAELVANNATAKRKREEDLDMIWRA